MNILELLFCYWIISFLMIFFLYADANNKKLCAKHFIKILLISIFLGWILVPIKIIIELVRIIKKL